MDVLMIEAKARHAVQITPGASAIANAPCDYILIDTDQATVTVELEEDSGAPITVPLASGVWHPMACTKITAVSSGNVWAGWLKLPGQNKG